MSMRHAFALIVFPAASFLLLPTGAALAAVVTNNPTACADDASIGTEAWVSPGNAVSSNDSFATVGVAAKVTSHYLMATGFSFDLPTNAIVDGIIASVRRKTSGGVLRDASVSAVKAGAVTGANMGSTAKWPTTAAYANYGGNMNLWGVTWTPQEINDSGFGVAAAVRNGSSGNRTASIDHMRLAVAYRVPPAVSNDGGVSNIVGTIVTVNGQVLAGDPPPTAYFFWGPADGGTDPSAWSNSLSVGPTNGFYSATLTSLEAFQAYWYRCYVSNSAGTAWAASSTNFATLAPAIWIGDVTVVEGFSGSADAVFPVSLSASSSLAVSFAFATSNGTAVAGSDYAATNGTVTLAPGQTSTSVTVRVFGDFALEPASETFYVNLGDVTNAILADGQGLGTILDDDSAPTIGYRGTPYVAGEGAGSQTVTVALSGPCSQPVSVSFGTSNGTAVAGTDYVATNGSVAWAIGETNTKSFVVQINDDFLLDGDKTFYVRLSNAVNGTNEGSGVTNVTVTDDEVVPAVDDGDGASAVVSKAATLNGRVTAGWPLPAAFVYWGQTDGGTTQAAWSNEIAVGITNGAFAVSVTGLVPEVMYYYRCYASNAVGAVWAPAESDFTPPAYEYWIDGVTRGTGGVTVFWAGGAGWTYTLRFSSNLMESGAWWAVPGGSNLPGYDGSMSCTDTNSGGQARRWYRLFAW